MTSLRTGLLVLLVLVPNGVLLASPAGQKAARSIGESAQIFEATLPEVVSAVTNTFDSLRYHETLIIPAHYDLHTRVWSVEHVTNEWQLFTGTLPLATVPRGKKLVPYFAQFDITASPISTNRCKLVVITTSSWVHDGREIGIHGGWAAHAVDVDPVPQEETNLLKQIEAHLIAATNGAAK